jgi:hypothetical protein
MYRRNSHNFNFTANISLKIKVKLSHYHHAATRVMLDLSTRWGEWSASHPSSTFPPRKGPPVPFG